MTYINTALFYPFNETCAGEFQQIPLDAVPTLHSTFLKQFDQIHLKELSTKGKHAKNTK